MVRLEVKRSFRNEFGHDVTIIVTYEPGSVTVWSSISEKRSEDEMWTPKEKKNLRELMDLRQLTERPTTFLPAS